MEQGCQRILREKAYSSDSINLGIFLHNLYLTTLFKKDDRIYWMAEFFPLLAAILCKSYNSTGLQWKWCCRWWQRFVRTLTFIRLIQQHGTNFHHFSNGKHYVTALSIYTEISCAENISPTYKLGLKDGVLSTQDFFLFP